MEKFFRYEKYSYFKSYAWVLFYISNVTFNLKAARSVLIVLRSKLFCAMLIPVAFFFLYLAYYGFRDEGLDDFFMAATLSGAYGLKYRVYMLFVNVLYGYMLLPLYALFPSVNWYNVGEALLSLCAMGTVVYVLLWKAGRRAGFLLGVLFCAVFCKDMFLEFNFTHFAGILAAAGGLWTAECIAENWNWKRWLWGGFLLLMASLIRYEAFLMSLPFFGATVAYCFVFKTGRGHLLRNALGLALIALCVVGAKKFDSYMYARDAGLSYYRSYSDIRASIVDYNDFDYGGIYDAMEDAGFKSVDARMLNRWTFYDTEVFSLDNLKKMQKIIRDNYPPESYRLKNAFLYERFSNAFRLPMFWFCLLLGFLAYRSDRRSILALWAGFAIAAAMYTYFVYIGRLPLRLEYCIWVSCACLVIFASREWSAFTAFLTRKKAAVALLGLCCLLPLYLDSSRKKIPVPAYINLQNYMKNRPGELFLIEFEKYKTMGAVIASGGIFKSVPKNGLSNQIPLGYWNVGFPGITDILKSRGINNPMRAVADDRVYVVGQMNKEYLREHYPECLSAIPERIYSKDSSFVFRYSKDRGGE